MVKSKLKGKSSDNSKKAMDFEKGLAAARRSGLFKEVFRLPEIRKALGASFVVSLLVTIWIMWPLANTMPSWCHLSQVACMSTLLISTLITFCGGATLMFLGLTLGIMAADAIILAKKK